MKRIFLIGWKDLRLIFRDPGALVLMLLAPFLLTIGMGFITGRFSGSGSTGLSDIPVVIVNQDGGQLGNALVELFTSEDLKPLIIASSVDQPDTARAQVEADKVAAAIIIPSGFTDSIIPPAGKTGPTYLIRLLLVTNPARPNSSGVVRAILEQFISQLEVGRISGEVAVTQLIQAGLVRPQDAAALGAQIGARAAEESSAVAGIRAVTSGGEEVKFDIMAFMAPGMALMFLMYTVSNGGRTLYLERLNGTLPRLMVAPVSPAQVLAGKVFGIFLSGAAQMLILILASSLLFSIRWGNPLGVLGMVITAVIGAVGWGLLITAISKTAGQVGAIGSAVMLIFGILGGSFIDTSVMPDWFQAVSRITPNAWGISGFTILSGGGSIADIWQPMLALVVMGVVLFAIAATIINRRGVIQR